MNSNERLILGIAGGGGSGKTSIAKAIQARLEVPTLLIHLDEFRVADQSKGPFSSSASSGITHVDWNHPDSIDVTRVIQDILGAREKVIIVEGIFALHFAPLRDLMACKMYVDADDDLRVLRKISRNFATRGQAFETSIRNHLESGRIGHGTYVVQTKTFADLIVNGETDVDKNGQLLTALLRGLLSN
jgi:uridine kinase